MRALMVALALPVLGISLGASAAAAGADRGHAVFNTWCAPCHAAGPGHPGTQALAAKYRGTPSGELEKRTDLTDQFINQIVRHGISIMPIFRKTEVSDDDLAALDRYLAKAGH
jgi:mono/diheme cytochrome c family protein